MVGVLVLVFCVVFLALGSFVCFLTKQLKLSTWLFIAQVKDTRCFRSAFCNVFSPITYLYWLWMEEVSWQCWQLDLVQLHALCPASPAP